MSNNKINPELKTFYQVTKNPKFKGDLPLYIIETGISLAEDYWKELDGTIKVFKLNSSSLYESLLNTLIESTKQKTPLLVQIEADPHPMVINLLNEISTEGAFTSGKTKTGLSSPLMFAIQRQLLEGGISYPRFYNLFGAGVSIK